MESKYDQLSLYAYNLPCVTPTQNPTERLWLTTKGGGLVEGIITCNRPFDECLREEMPKLVREVGLQHCGMRRVFPMLHFGEQCVTRDLAIEAKVYLDPTQGATQDAPVTNLVRCPSRPNRYYLNQHESVVNGRSVPITPSRTCKRDDCVNGSWEGGTESASPAEELKEYLKACSDLVCVEEKLNPLGNGELYYVCDCEEYQKVGKCPHSIAVAFPERVRLVESQAIMTGIGHERQDRIRNEKRRFRYVPDGASKHKRSKSS